MSYVVSGYFDGLAYEWSDLNRVYTVSMSQQDYRQFLKNKGVEDCNSLFVDVLSNLFNTAFFYYKDSKYPEAQHL